jgi:hypothetical protein
VIGPTEIGSGGDVAGLSNPRGVPVEPSCTVTVWIAFGAGTSGLGRPHCAG